MTCRKAYEQIKKKRGLLEAEHQEGCPSERYFPNTPIDVANCDCYEYAVFKEGYFAARGVKV